jgi:ketosteroid isomerase-like protein
MLGRQMALFVACAAATHGLSAQTDFRDEMKPTYEALAKAYNSKDLDAVLKHADKDFKWKLVDGKEVNRDAAKASIRDQFERINSGNWEIKLTNAYKAGPVAITTAEYTFKGSVLDPAKKAYDVEFETVERHRWFRTGDQWVLTRAEVVSHRTVSQGQKVTPNAKTEGKPPR